MYIGMSPPISSTVKERVIEFDPLLPVAKQLGDLSLSFDQILPWIDTVHEKSEAEKMDTRAAAYSLAKDLRSYRQLRGLQKSLQQAEQQLTIIEAFTAQKQKAIMALMNFAKHG